LTIGAAAIAAVVVTLIVGLWLGMPAAARWGIETVVAREIGRPTQIGDIRFNPLTLRLELRDLAVGGAPGEPLPLLTPGQLHAQVSARSIWRLAPIVRSRRLQTLRANITRLAPNRFPFSDIVDRAVALDDRFVGKKNAITDITVGIPFISSLPDDEEAHVKPALCARVNGTPFEREGETLPFSESLDTSVTIRLTGLHLPTYLAYVPLPLQFSLPRGELDTDLRLAFRRAVAAPEGRPAQPLRLLLTGRATVRDLAVLANDVKEPLVA